MRGLILLLAACSSSDPWGYGAHLSPGDDPTFEAAIRSAADHWNVALEPCGGLALHVVSGGHPVLEVPRGTDLGTKDAAGVFDGRSIRILVDLAEWEDGVLTHEMGHALGFDHVPPSVDPQSIMNPSIGPGRTVSAGDVVRARSHFGCR